MHPCRIPPEYWRHRIQMAKSMGLNTIGVYIMWNFHDEDGVLHFDTPDRNISRFIEIVKEENLWLLFRPGPYVCAEWDFGGLPSRLLQNRTAMIRTIEDPNYKYEITQYVNQLAPQVLPHMIYNGGNVLMVQLENEYSVFKYADGEYIRYLKQLWINNNVTGPFYSADNAQHISDVVHVEGAALGVNSEHPGEWDFETAHKFDPTVPVLVSEVWTGWFSKWG